MKHIRILIPYIETFIAENALYGSLSSETPLYSLANLISLKQSSQLFDSPRHPLQRKEALNYPRETTRLAKQMNFSVIPFSCV